jgi:ATPase subunit of ABC transporter with duplicated ATPase domains
MRPLDLTIACGERLLIARPRRAARLPLDEPTNHLDIELVEVLESAPGEWPVASS